ncbi:MFS transporter [Streptomyces sp. NPDC050610]|uniref:MFS transporter n=1 Tax=Streptomyces sp. NPDC050610 TaxID=3157097 RepID=UPI003423D20C
MSAGHSQVLEGRPGQRIRSGGNRGEGRHRYAADHGRSGGSARSFQPGGARESHRSSHRVRRAPLPTEWWSVRRGKWRTGPPCGAGRLDTQGPRSGESRMSPSPTPAPSANSFGSRGSYQIIPALLRAAMHRFQAWADTCTAFLRGLARIRLLRTAGVRAKSYTGCEWLLLDTPAGHMRKSAPSSLRFPSHERCTVTFLGRGLALFLLCAAQFIAILDFSITTVPLPEIQRELGFSPGGLQWVVNAYGVAIAGSLLLGGRAADIFGRRRIFVAGTALFTVASLVGGFASSPLMLIITRALQGLGAALFSPAAFSLLTTTFPSGKERNRALGAWAAVAASGLAAGVILGGFITDVLGWRWVLWINVPLGALVVALARTLPKGLPESRSRPRLDVAGALLVAGGLTALVYAFANSEHAGLGDPLTLGLGAVALVLLAAFVRVESKTTDPLMSLGLFRKRSVTGANVVSLLANTGLGPTFIIVALHMQIVIGFTPLETGLGLLPMAGAFLLFSAWAGPALVARFGAKPVIVAGMTLFAVALGILGFSLSADGAWAATVLPGASLAGAGYGIAFPAWTVAGIEDVEPEDHGLAGGMLTTTQEVGSAVGLAIGLSVAAGLPGAEGYSRAVLLAGLLTVVGVVAALVILPRRSGSYGAAGAEGSSTGVPGRESEALSTAATD